MTNELNDKINTACKMALEHFGETAQIVQTLEEMSELGVELSKIANKRTDPRQLAGHRARLVDEMADVAFMMRQITMMFDITDEEIAAVLQRKSTHLIGRIQRIQFINKHGVEP